MASSSKQLVFAAGESLHEVVMENEEKDLWQAFLQKGDYAMAARYANGQVHYSRDVMVSGHVHQYVTLVSL